VALNISRATPYVFSGFGMLINNVFCQSITNPYLSHPCSVLATMGMTAGGIYFPPAWNDVCLLNFQAIENKCGEEGGAVEAESYTSTYTRNGIVVDRYAVNSTLWASPSLDETLPDVCPAIPSYSSTYCQTMSCTAAVCQPA